MPDYSIMYYKLISAQADAIDDLSRILEKLIQAHKEVEELYMQNDEAGCEKQNVQKNKPPH